MENEKKNNSLLPSCTLCAVHNGASLDAAVRQYSVIACKTRTSLSHVRTQDLARETAPSSVSLTGPGLASGVEYFGIDFRSNTKRWERRKNRAKCKQKNEMIKKTKVFNKRYMMKGTGKLLKMEVVLNRVWSCKAPSNASSSRQALRRQVASAAGKKPSISSPLHLCMHGARSAHQAAHTCVHARLVRSRAFLCPSRSPSSLSLCTAMRGASAVPVSAGLSLWHLCCWHVCVPSSGGAAWEICFFSTDLVPGEQNTSSVMAAFPGNTGKSRKCRFQMSRSEDAPTNDDAAGIKDSPSRLLHSLISQYSVCAFAFAKNPTWSLLSVWQNTCFEHLDEPHCDPQPRLQVSQPVHERVIHENAVMSAMLDLLRLSESCSSLRYTASTEDRAFQRHQIHSVVVGCSSCLLWAPWCSSLRSSISRSWGL